MTVSNIPAGSAAAKYQNINRLIAFKLHGPAVPTPPPLVVPPVPKPPAQTGTPAQIRAGEVKFVQECSRCHVFGPSVTPDLRRLDPGIQAIFKDIVLKGAVAPTGMERFDDILSEADVEAIHDYLIDESWKAYRAQEAAAAKH